MQVLDLGCGSGFLGRILVDRGFRVTGVERQDGYAKPFPASVTLVEADLDQGLPPLDAAFDFILCGDILEHLRHPARLLEQLHAHLKPGGALVASLPNSGNIYFRLNILLGHFPQDDRGLFDRTHLHFFMWDGWVRLLTTSGFHIERLAVSGIPVGLALPGWKGSLPVKAAEALSYSLARIWKKLFAYQFVITAVSTRNPQ